MDLKEVLEKATERPWGSKLALGDYEGHAIRSPSDKLVAVTATTHATTLDEEETANGILIPHAVNKLEGLLEAAKGAAGFMLSGTGDYGRSNDSIAETFGGNDRLMALTEAIRETEEVSP